MDGPTDAGAGAAHESDAARVERVWRRFSPAPNDIVPGRCYARLWGDGKGTQCTRHPKPGCATCTMHSRFQPHGLVTGPIPPKKLQEFLKAELRRSVRASAGNADAGAARLSAAAGPPRRQRHRHWYTRARMWAEASLLDTPQRQEERGREIHSLEDLTAAEYASCLDRVDGYFKYNQKLQAAVGRPSGFVERDKGPRTADERASQAADYNGRGGGRSFKWYWRPIFERCLRRFGSERYGLETCTEKQCMQALQAASEELSRFPLVTVSLAAFAGPQCFPHLKDPARVRANEVARSRAAAGGSKSLQVFRQVEEGWLRCDACRKWRLVDRQCLPSLTPAAFSAQKEGCADFDWGAWVAAARGRYQAFLEERSAASGGDLGEAREALAPASAPVPASAAMCAEEEGESPCAETASDVSKSSLGSSDCGSDDGEHAERGNFRSKLDSALADLGARGGGLRAAEVQEQARLLKRAGAAERSRAAPQKRKRGVSPPKGPMAGAPVRALFRCDMLLKREVLGEEAAASLEWAPMTCADEDDAAGLMARAWSVKEDFEVGEAVALWAVDAAAPPHSDGGYARRGHVVRIVQPGEAESGAAAPRMSLRSGASAREGAPEVQEQGKVVVHVEECRRGERVLRALKELHLVPIAGSGGGAPGAARWRVLPHPWTAAGGNRRAGDCRRELVGGEEGLAAQLADARGRLAAGSRKSSCLAKVVGELEAACADPPLREELVVLPVQRLPLRVAKYDVPLREGPLRAVHAQQAIITSMVLFECRWCQERFAAFHPAYAPPEWLGLELLKRGGKGVALCSVEVATWDEPPSFPPPRGVAPTHTGVCRRCQLDIEEQVAAQAPEEAGGAIVPKFSFLNHMDPVFRFPREELQQLFDSASIVEAMLVALEHMQVNFVTVSRTRLHKFKKNVISFPQDIAAFARRVGLLDGYRAGDRVNSVCGPGEDLARAPRVAVAASEEERQVCGVDEEGRLVFAATVLEVTAAGVLSLSYDVGGRGLETPSMVWPRVRMPWHPKFLKGQLAFMLRRNIGQGRVLEGLEVRWDMVSRLLGALTCVGPWRLDGSVGPMHSWYSSKLFDRMTASEFASVYDAAGADGAPRDIRTAEGLVQAGFDVRLLGEAEDEGVAADGEPALDVDESTFVRWLTLAACSLGTAVAEWWLQQPADAENAGGVGLKACEEETSSDLFARICEGVAEPGGTSRASVTVPELVAWLIDHNAGGAFTVADEDERRELSDDVLLELSVAAAQWQLLESSGSVERAEECGDAEEEALRGAERVVYGWPSRKAEATEPRAPGRFAKSFPLEFPMGVADLYDERPRPVTVEEYVQHMLRHGSGRMVNDARGHRLLWALVNTTLLREAQGKGVVVHRNCMRRFGARLHGQGVMTKAMLRDMLQSEETMRSLVGQLMSVGKEVRSTPMHWSFEGRKLTAAVQYLSWRPPWVQSHDPAEEMDPGARFVPEAQRVPDRVGRPRVPALWWTLNPRYNSLHEVHRLNTGSPYAADALLGGRDAHAQVRFDFVRNAPDIVAFLIALRTELHMRIVQPALVPHTEREPFLAMARFECGDHGNPHYHGFSVGAGNPRLQRVRADAGDAQSGDEAPCSDDGGSEDLSDAGAVPARDLGAASASAGDGGSPLVSLSAPNVSGGLRADGADDDGGNGLSGVEGASGKGRPCAGGRRGRGRGRPGRFWTEEIQPR